MRLDLLEVGTVRASGAPVLSYLIRTDGIAVLVDTGFGPSGRPNVARPASQAGPPGAPRTGSAAPLPGGAELTGAAPVEVNYDVLDRLAALGVEPAEVRYVVCSHLDPDHAGRHDRFPRAEFVIQAEHLALARSGTSERLQAARRSWDHPELHYRTVTGDIELVSGVELLASGGHVPGHQSVLVRLPRSGPVLLAVDAIPTADDLDPRTRRIYPFDQDPDEVRRSTGRLVALAAREDAWIVYGHDRRQWAELSARGLSYQ